MSAFEFLGRRVPERAIIGLLGDEHSGISEQLQRAASHGRYFSHDASPDFSDAAGLLLLDYTLDARDPLVRLRASRALSESRRQGNSVLLASWNEDLLAQLCDEIWWIDESAVLVQGDPAEVLQNWRADILFRWQSELTGVIAPIEPWMRAGDNRARIQSLQLLNAQGEPVLVWMSGDPAHIRVVILFNEPVDDPVVGMLIRTRVGLNVYGTNTELESLRLGPRAAGDTIEVSFRFRCDLCPAEYTLTVASHDPNGVWHEWLEDAVAFSVGDTRYTAGVANLRAEVSWELR